VSTLIRQPFTSGMLNKSQHLDEEGLLCSTTTASSSEQRQRQPFEDEHELDLAAQLRQCFDHRGLSSDEYEDLLEQKLYALRCFVA